MKTFFQALYTYLINIENALSKKQLVYLLPHFKLTKIFTQSGELMG
jgi:hypothetical protein